jgi:HSP20 family protein
MKLTNYNNPIVNLEKTIDSFFNITPLFHQLEEVYRTGDQVRFANSEEGLTVQVDLPGVDKSDLDISVDTDQRDVYIKATRSVKTHEGQRDQTYNRSFSIGREYDLNNIVTKYVNGLLEVSVPRRKKETYIRKITL